MKCLCGCGIELTHKTKGRKRTYLNNAHRMRHKRTINAQESKANSILIVVSDAEAAKKVRERFESDQFYRDSDMNDTRIAPVLPHTCITCKNLKYDEQLGFACPKGTSQTSVTMTHSLGYNPDSDCELWEAK